MIDPEAWRRQRVCGLLGTMTAGTVERLVAERLSELRGKRGHVAYLHACVERAGYVAILCVHFAKSR
jgi:hypothetical protein